MNGKFTTCGDFYFLMMLNMYCILYQYRRTWLKVNLLWKLCLCQLPRLWEGDACMMTSSNGNIFRVTGLLCGEFTGPGEFPTQRTVTRSFDVCFDPRPNKRLSKQPWGWWFETPSWSLWRQCNGLNMFFILQPIRLTVDTDSGMRNYRFFPGPSVADKSSDVRYWSSISKSALLHNVVVLHSTSLGESICFLLSILLRPFQHRV